MADRRLVLASASPSRRALLEGAGLAFEVRPADLDEAAVKNSFDGPADELAVTLAEKKALAISQTVPEALIIGADQVLVLGDRLFDKPPSVDAARATLAALRGRTHQLVDGVALASNGAVAWRHKASVTLKMREFSDAFLDDYVERLGDRMLTSVGAYHLEGLGAQLFERVDGDYFTVLGLPLLPLLEELRARHHALI